MILTSWEVDEYNWDNAEGEKEEEDEGVRQVFPHQDQAKLLHCLQHVLVIVQEGPVVYYHTEYQEYISLRG